MVGATEFVAFEGILRRYAQERGLSFQYDGVPVEEEMVFHPAGFAPGLLAAAQVDMHARGLNVNLGLVIEADASALFGRRVTFQASTPQAQMWRLLQASYMLDALPRAGNVVVLDDVPAVFDVPDLLPPSLQVAAAKAA